MDYQFTVGPYCGADIRHNLYRELHDSILPDDQCGNRGNRQPCQRLVQQRPRRADSGYGKQWIYLQQLDRLRFRFLHRNQ